MEAALRRIERAAITAAAEGRESVVIGPFRAILDPTSDLPFVSYAVPVAPLPGREETAAAIDRLADLFASRGRRLRFEFTLELWPDLEARLAAAGLVRERADPKMVVLPKEFQDRRVPEVRVEMLAPDAADEVLAEFFRVRNLGYGLDCGPPGREERDQFRENLASGTARAALARVHGAAAGIGVALGASGVAELAGVATHPDHRRRGVAITVSSALVSDHFQRGGDLVWLSAGDAVAEAVYGRVGFRRVATHAAWIAPARG